MDKGGGNGSGKARRAPVGCVDAEAKRRFLSALKRGVTLEAAAREAGCSLSPFYKARTQDVEFAADWADALELSALRERAHDVALPPMDGEDMRIAPNGKRRLQLRKMRQVRFAGKRIETFLAHFAGTGDVSAAAAAAGVDESTVYNRYRKDPVFAADWDAALMQAYLTLDAEALRQRLAAQKRMRGEIVPAGEVAAEFGRVMQLLERAERRLKRGEGRSFVKVTPKRPTFDAAIEALDRKLRALGLVIPPLPADVAARYDVLPPPGDLGTVTSDCPLGTSDCPLGTEGTVTFTDPADSLSHGGAESDCP